MNNIPEIKIGLIAVSRDCFPAVLSEKRRKAISEICKDIYSYPITVQTEDAIAPAIDDLKKNNVNALVVFLGNFGPEAVETMIAQKFDGPVMYCAAAEGDGDLYDGRGDAYCGMLNCSYNLGLRNQKAYIPENPVGRADDIAKLIEEFTTISRAVIGIKNLKIFTFGPRPENFFACNAPIKGLYDLGVEVQENSELDLLVAFNEHKDDKRIPGVMKDMEKELGPNNKYAGVLPRLAQYEITLYDWAKENIGASKYFAFANKCWPSFQTQFGFVPCYVNSRLTKNGIPVSCEVDIYGALSEYIGCCVSQKPVTLLDINNTVPDYIYNSSIKDKYTSRIGETFMGFHCGNTATDLLQNAHMGYQLIMKRSLEPDLCEPDITRGTIEGDIKPGDITFFRLQSTADAKLVAYIAQGEVLDVPTQSFGSIGIFKIPDMERFYRHVLIEKRYPHHGAVAFGHYGKLIFEVFKYLGIKDISFNQPKGMLYPSENPFA